MRVNQGGTNIWCPGCKKVAVCAGVNPSTIGARAGQRYYRQEHPDVNWFRRGRICQDCGHEFLTAELSEEFVEELVVLRDSLVDLKRRAENVSKGATDAAKAIAKLEDGINALRNFQMWRDA